MPALVRSPIEVTLQTGITLRGVTVGGDPNGGPVIILVHDIGGDLDEFGTLPEVLAGLGYRTVAVDLPGHGLSDGDDVDPLVCASAIRELVAVFAGTRIGLVVSGRSATVGASLGANEHVIAQVLVNPVLDAALDDGSARTHAIRMVVHGDGPNIVGTETQRFFSHLIGEKMLVFNASMAGGPRMLTIQSTVQAHVELFFTRYLIRPS
jgi:pimeloyl-ACP methyl ester carboxylesterase